MDAFKKQVVSLPMFSHGNKNPTAPKIRTVYNAASIGIFIPPAWASGLQEKYHKSDGQGFSTKWIPQNHLPILDDANPEHDNQLLMQPH